ncbi:MAG: hypothetical protein IBJ11_12040 [Phycisphaerales bacterium]|nr:hypothetical protein [Phycisphaerales bacterium]
MTARPRAGALAAAACAALAGCGSPTITGRVIDGPQPYAMLVDPDDPRLQEAGVGEATVHLVLDPNWDRKTRWLDRARTDADGRFVIEVPRAFPKFMGDQFGLQAAAEGYVGAEWYGPMPPDHKVLLMVVTPRPQ